MKLSRSTLSVALLAALVAPAAHAEIAIDVIGGSEVSFEGLVQADMTWFDNDGADLNAGTATANGGDGKDSEFDLRRSELVLKGKGPGNFEWVLGYEAKDNKFLDTNIKYKFGNNANHYIQVGQFKQTNSMEELSSTKNNDFIAKASITNTFGIARRLGVAYNYGDVNWGITTSIFGRELTRNRNHGSGYGARGYWAPINEQGNIFHVGLSCVNFDTDNDTARWRARPLADQSTIRMVDTGSLTDTDRANTTGVESFWVHGPFKLQGEYMANKTNRYAHGDFKGAGGYISGLWNVTGETWGYKAGTPTTGLPDDPSKGMWQLGLRYDTIDLNDGAVAGGKMDSWTLGANWYWHSNFKFAMNYVMVNTKKAGVSDDPNVLEARVQFYW
ncbi:OprO/OprP family phosphate-selective porin [Lysobacter fragariae]